MKHSYHYLFILLLLPLFQACNGDVFIDELKVPLTEATLDGDGDTLTIRFNTSQWQLTQAYNGEVNEPHTTYYSGKFYTLDGKDMGTTSCTLDGKGKIVVNCPPYELTLIRPNDKELQICMGDNPTKEFFQFSLSIRDKDYIQYEDIHLTQNPGSGYVIDGIEYELTPGSIRTEIREDCFFSYTNLKDEPETETYNLNERMNRWIYLSCNTDIHFAQTGNEPHTIAIPDIDISQGLKPSAERIRYFQYGSDISFMNVEPPYLRTMTFQPGDTNLMRLVEYQVYDANYILHLRNAKTGKLHAVQGTMTNWTPMGTIGWYLR